ncbi:hypothetical protein LTR85_003398 [Meristemomyces frigidus]|nr:hypothetical protein LTR85_003398 [Meristemomyces frigidus]
MDDSASLSAPAVTQDSPLLRLPAELKNHIYELSTRASATILVRAERRTTTEGKTTYRVYPDSPALTAVCRQTRNDYPYQFYYAGDLFLLTDSIFKPELFSRSFGAHGKAAQAITHSRQTSSPH